jgi:hypothetical protein
MDLEQAKTNKTTDTNSQNSSEQQLSTLESVPLENGNTSTLDSWPEWSKNALILYPRRLFYPDVPANPPRIDDPPVPNWIAKCLPCLYPTPDSSFGKCLTQTGSKFPLFKPPTPRKRQFVQIVYFLVAAIGMWLLLYFNSYSATASPANPQYDGFSSVPVVPESGPPDWIGCYQQLWGLKNACGLNGRECGPFESDQTWTVRCPRSCGQARTQEVQWHGDQAVYNDPVVIGNNSIYRADSYICPAAIREGLVSDLGGGCLVVRTIGSQNEFGGDGIPVNGIVSWPFPSGFPKAYRVEACTQATACFDFSWVTYVYLWLGALLALLLFPLPRLGYVYYLTLFGFFATIAFMGPPGNLNWLSAQLGASLWGIITTTYLVYRLCLRHTLPSPLSNHIIETTLYTSLYILGLLMEFLSGYFPDVTLTAQMFSYPDRVIMLVVYLVIGIPLVIYVLYWQRKIGRLPSLLLFYATFFLLFFLIPVFWPGLYYHLHHWMLSLLILPLTAHLETRIGMCIQAFALGWFVEGVGRWGFDTPAEPIERHYGAADYGRERPDFVWGNWTPPLDSKVADAWQVQWTWPSDPPVADITVSSQNISGLAGYSLLMNDVEVFRSTFATYRADAPTNRGIFNLSDDWFVRNWRDGSYFFRIAGISMDGVTLDYTDPVRAFLNGTVQWINGTIIQ